MNKRSEEKEKEALINELCSKPDLGAALKKLRISTPQFYVWGREDGHFLQNVFLLLDSERTLSSLLVEQKVMQMALAGHFPSIKLILEHNSSRYRKKPVNHVQEHEDFMVRLDIYKGGGG